MVSTRRSGGPAVNIELSFNGKDLKKVIPIAEQRRLQEEEQDLSDDEPELVQKKERPERSSADNDERAEDLVARETRTTRRATRGRPAKAKGNTKATGKTSTKGNTKARATPTATTTRKSNLGRRKTTKLVTLKATTTAKGSSKETANPKPTTRATRGTKSTRSKSTGATETRISSDEEIPLLTKKETRGRPRKHPIGPDGKPVIPDPSSNPATLRKRRGRPRNPEIIMGEKRKFNEADLIAASANGYASKKYKVASDKQEAGEQSPSTSESSVNGVTHERIPSMQGATIQPISEVISQHAATSPNIHKHNINHLLSKDAPTAAYPPNSYATTTPPTNPSSAPYASHVQPPSSSSYSSGYSPQYQPYPQPPYLQQSPPYPYQQYSQALHPPYPLVTGSMMPPRQQPAPPTTYSQQPLARGPPDLSSAPVPLPSHRQQPLPAATPLQEPHGRIPITSIISQKIDSKDLPSILYDGDTTRGDGDDDDDGEDEREGDGEGEDEGEGDGEGDDGNEGRKTKRRYRIDRENIKINKRIMSQDTEDVIKMFRKFDDEVLTNPEARQRLLSLGFETRKRYITTFKHYIRFCCRKKMNDFFVTGELMREFYQEQFAMSTSSNPVIRLRKMDPAFSKLQEINYIVYNLDSKEIPNRHIALEYLIYKELGKEPGDNIDSIIDDKGVYQSELIKGKRKRRTNRKHRSIDYPMAIYAPEKGRRPNHGTDGGNQTLLVHPALPPLPALVKENQEKLQKQREQEVQLRRRSDHLQGSNNGAHEYVEEQTYHQHTPSTTLAQIEPSSHQQHVHSQSTTPPVPMYPKKITKKNIEEVRRSFGRLCAEINSYLQDAVGVEPAFVSKLRADVNASLNQFDLELNGPRPPRPPPPQTTASGVPIYDLQQNIFTVYEILDEWYNGTPQQPSVAQRLEQYGEEWIRDEFEYNTFVERRSVVEFVERLSKETKVDIWVIANDCDKYIRDKSILDEFISEIELDVEDLFKRILRYRQRRG
ncbi:hypothetical protein CANMA_003605 [Candida margitis]|uniref:uncharacterized protein n=1 Tax=Candida margitis TaxID=1775924 RepID=UPI002227CA25|nr:uncharacterized protein CANMA_003605 [Candida margitis]KAI5962830.1 hypothetical protein CANMA_003605 [Candida margitis]